MQTGTPHMQNFQPSSPYAYGESPHVYGDQFVMCQQSFLQSCVDTEFCAHTHAHPHKKSLSYCIVCALMSKIITASHYFDSIIPHLNKCRGRIQVTILMTEFRLTTDTAQRTQITCTDLILSTNLRVVLRKANLQILMTEF